MDSILGLLRRWQPQDRDDCPRCAQLPMSCDATTEHDEQLPAAALRDWLADKTLDRAYLEEVLDPRKPLN